MTDREGRQKPSITLKLLPGQVTPVQFESLAYIPPGIPRIGDRIAAVLIGEDLIGRISIVRLDGTVEFEVPVAPGSPAENYVVGMAFLPPDSFLFAPLVGTDSVVYQTDLAGVADQTDPGRRPGTRFRGHRGAVRGANRRARLCPGQGPRLRLPGHSPRTPGSGLLDRPRHLQSHLRGLGLQCESHPPDRPHQRQLHAPECLCVELPVHGGGPGHPHGGHPDVLAQGHRLPRGHGRIAYCEQGGNSQTRGIWLFDAVTGDYRSRLALASFPSPTSGPCG